MDNFIEKFKHIIEESFERLSLITESDSSKSRNEGKWSPKQIIGHLIDSAANNHQRIVNAQLKEDMIFDGYDQDYWVSSQCYNEESWKFLLQLWRWYNMHLIHVVSKIPSSNLKKNYSKHNLHIIGWKPVDENESVSLEYLIEDYVGHLEHHLKKIEGL